jgi:ElaB/YqjD/DUF883 family membrane-anchored ribosome-binding protein
MNSIAANSLASVSRASSPASFEITEPLFTVGDVRKVMEAQVRSTDKGLRDFVTGRPVFALTLATVFGFFLGRLLAR